LELPQKFREEVSHKVADGGFVIVVGPSFMASFMAVCDRKSRIRYLGGSPSSKNITNPKLCTLQKKKSLKMTFATFASSLIPRENGWHSILPGLSALGFKKKSALHRFF